MRPLNLKFPTLILLVCCFLMEASFARQAILTEPYPHIAVSAGVGFKAPLDDGLIYLISQSGIIYWVDTNLGHPQQQTWLNITDRVQSGGERGLLGLAFHPNFEENGYFFVSYTAGSPLRSVVSRFEADAAGLADNASELILLEFNQPFTNHNGGDIAFGPDGYLYIASGDGGSGGDPQNNAQNTQNLLGAMLRIDVDNPDDGLNYGIPDDNIFFGSNVNRPEIFAWGLRNPWRFSFDWETGDLWTGDVGQNAWESIYIIENGLNYGWRIIEGSNCYSPATNCNTAGLEFPIFEYDHSNGDRSVTGGFVYRGSLHPEWYGKYIYGDFVSGRIWALDYDQQTQTVIGNEELINAPFNVSTFGEDYSGEIFVISYNSGRFYRLNRDTTTLEIDDEKPAGFVLNSAYPNPFNPTTTLSFTLSESGVVAMEVYNSVGQKVGTVTNQNYTAGNHTVQFDATSLSSGVYLIRAIWAGSAQYQRVTLIK